MMIRKQEILNASILIVDDQYADVLLLEGLLQEVGYTFITSTTDPYTVGELHRKNRYDLILLDLQMPGMDGFQVMNVLKEIEADNYLPVLAITVQPEHMLRALADGVKDFISKPFDLMETKTRIHNMLEVRLQCKQLERLSLELESIALHNALTGLPNRCLLLDRLTMGIAHARRNKSKLALMYLDLDGFKQVNDTLGHAVGDQLLCLVASRLLATMRQEDTVSRLGGDEFVIVLWEPSQDESVDKLALKVIQTVSQPYNIQGHSVNITVSVGVSTYPMHGEEVETLMKSADLALYEAKHSGKNNYRRALPATDNNKIYTA